MTDYVRVITLIMTPSNPNYPQIKNTLMSPRHTGWGVMSDGSLFASNQRDNEIKV